jgi:hypothetical protein
MEGGVAPVLRGRTGDVVSNPSGKVSLGNCGDRLSRPIIGAPPGIVGPTARLGVWASGGSSSSVGHPLSMTGEASAIYATTSVVTKKAASNETAFF